MNSRDRLDDLLCLPPAIQRGQREGEQEWQIRSILLLCTLPFAYHIACCGNLVKFLLNL